jgi:zinc protease
LSSPDISCEVLPNGLTVLLCPTELAPVAEFQIWAKVGAADERDDERGLAHFHEHMLFKGTERRGVGAVAGDVEGAGGRINAYTSYDVTVYHATVPSDRLDVGIDVISDAVLHSIFDPEELRREIDVVLEEIRRGDDSPGNVLGNALFAEAYQHHPYRHPIIGSAESVSSFDRESVRRFYERWYHPANLVVVAVGAFEPDFVLSRVEQAFAGARSGTATRSRPTEPTQDGLRTRILARPFERTHVEVAYPGVALSHPDAPLLDLLAYLLGNGDSSRLVRRLRERDGLVERVDAYSYTPLDRGIYSIDFETDAQRVEAAIEASVVEVEALRAAPVTSEELEKARINFLSHEHFERESVSGLAAKIGGFHVTAGSHEAEKIYLDTIRRATPEDLQRVAQEHCAPERATVAAILPEADAGALDAERIEAALGRAERRSARTFAPPRSEATGSDLHSYHLDGGARLHVLPRRSLPIVAARAAFLGGLLAETERTSGLTAFLSGMWMRGTENASAANFAEAVESRAAEIDSFSGRSSVGLTLETPSATLEPALDLFCDVLRAPAFDAEEFERERRETLAAIERREDRLAQRAFLLFGENHFQKHPYRMPTLGSAEVISGLEREAVVAHHEWLVKQENLVIAVAGDVDPDQIAQGFSRRLASLDASPFERPSPPAEPPPTEIRRAELRKDRAQAHLVIGFRGIAVDDDDRFTLDVISQILSGQGGRLFLDLRDRRGLAYSVTATSIEGVDPGYFALYIATTPERLEEARSGLLEELDRLLQSPPGEDELDRARRYLTGNFVIDQQRNAVHAAQVSLNALYGLGANASDQFVPRVEAVGPEDVLRVARRIIDLSAYTEAVVRP